MNEAHLYPLRLERETWIDPDRGARLHEATLDILHRVGLAVLREDARERLARAGFTVRGERVLIEPPAVEEYLADHRQRLAQTSTAANEPDDGRLWLTMNPYPFHVHDLARDQIVPYTTESLIEMTRFTDTFAEERVVAVAPGYPTDVPPRLQPIAQYRVGAEYARLGAKPVDPISPWAATYVFEMAEVLGQPIRRLPVYVFSPLRLGGESLDMVMQHGGRMEAIRVSSMPAPGTTAPVRPFAALALGAAEVIGSAVALTVITGKPVDFMLTLFPADLHSGAMVFGSPEAFLFGLAAADQSAFYGLDRGRRAERNPANVLTQANWPSAQAAAEKASQMTAGALLGARTFSGVGDLCLDEIFSAEQFLVDVEIRDHVERMIAGLSLDEQGYDWVEEVRQGVEESFMGLESTHAEYRQVYWRPRLFARNAQAVATGDARRALLDRTREVVRERVAGHDYKLEPTKRREIERIWQRAVAEGR